MIERKKYLDKLISRKNNGMVKVITGIRRCGKSYLLFNIYKDHLKSQGISDDQIVELALDEIENIRYRNPIELESTSVRKPPTTARIIMCSLTKFKKSYRCKIHISKTPKIKSALLT